MILTYVPCIISTTYVGVNVHTFLIRKNNFFFNVCGSNIIKIRLRELMILKYLIKILNMEFCN